MDASSPPPPRPIGYWLKHLHNLLERQFEGALAVLGEGVTRRHWQTLNTLSTGPRSRAELRAALAPFVAGDPRALDAVLDGPDGLAARGWTRTEGSGNAVALTPEGLAAHTRTAERIARTRTELLAGLTAEQYAETVRVLEVMAANAEAALAPG